MTEAETNRPTEVEEHRRLYRGILIGLPIGISFWVGVVIAFWLR